MSAGSYPLATCPHGAVEGYCANCRDEALDWAVAKCMRSANPDSAPVHLIPIIEASVERVMLKLRNPTAEREAIK